MHGIKVQPWQALTAFNDWQEAEKNAALAEEFGFSSVEDSKHIAEAKACYDALKTPS